MPLYTPATKKRKVLSKIVKAKEFDERGLDTAALEYYKIGKGSKLSFSHGIANSTFSSQHVSAWRNYCQAR